MDDYKRFQYLSKLFRTSHLPIGEDMYLIGKELNLSKEEVEEIIDYYRNGRVIEFPVLGSSIRLVRDWYKTLDERDRRLLTETFLLQLRKLSKRDIKELPIDYVFDSMELRAFSDVLAPIVAYSLKNENLIEIDGNLVKITKAGLDMAHRIDKERLETWKNTMRKLGLT